MSENFAKRSLILSEDLAAELDSMALAQGKSFTHLVREALQFWLKYVREEKTRDIKTFVPFTKEEQKLMDKLCQNLSVEAAGLLKQCWNQCLPTLIADAQKRKESLEEMTKRL